MSGGELKMTETWLVLGGSSAIARSFARAAAGDGADLLLAGRDRDDLDLSAADLRIRTQRRVEVVDFDALDFDSHAGTIRRAKEFAGDGTLNIFLAFGFMPLQEEINASRDLARRVVDINYTAVVSLLQEAAPIFEAQKRGAVVVVGSVAGDRGRPKNYVYGSAKAAVAAFMQGYRGRMFRAGVTVTTVKPGIIDTAMTWGLPGVKGGASPDIVAKDSLAAAKKGREVIYTPWPWRYIMAIVKAIPERVFKRLDF
ncbi:MAG: SDR family NAD(P)-dependent oxidoreductase [Alphaproteobacteria bacterium]|nr:SDR family NAD(P)-dependent oxidoreductase [Alphaproteobacteria bacterium]